MQDKEERVLSKKEKRLLANANLTPRVERFVRGIWSKEKEPAASGVIGGIITSVIAVALIPTLIFILGANIFHWASVPKGFENIAFFVIWILFVVVALIFSIARYFMVNDMEPSSILSYQSIKTLVGGNIFYAYYSRLTVLVLICLIAYRGELITAAALLIVWIIGLASNSALKGRIKTAIEALE